MAPLLPFQPFGVAQPTNSTMRLRCKPPIASPQNKTSSPYGGAFQKGCSRSVLQRLGRCCYWVASNGSRVLHEPRTKLLKCASVLVGTDLSSTTSPPLIAEHRDQTIVGRTEKPLHMGYLQFSVTHVDNAKIPSGSSKWS